MSATSITSYHTYAKFIFEGAPQRFQGIRAAEFQPSKPFVSSSFLYTSLRISILLIMRSSVLSFLAAGSALIPGFVNGSPLRRGSTAQSAPHFVVYQDGMPGSAS
jgi:hypothetical protein